MRTLHYAVKARNIRCNAVINYKMSPTFKVGFYLFPFFLSFFALALVLSVVLVFFSPPLSWVSARAHTHPL